MTDLAYDIETVGPPWADLDETTQAYLERRAEQRGTEPAPERTGLDLGLHRIVAVGLAVPGTDRRHSLVALDPAQEAGLLEEFWRMVQGRGRLITYNGRGFDGPALMIRSAILGVRVTRDLAPYRYDWTHHLDLADALTCLGATRTMYSLDYWCRRFGAESPKIHGDGASVADMSASELTTYVEADAAATAELYERLRVTGYLSHTRGGPRG